MRAKLNNMRQLHTIMTINREYPLMVAETPVPYGNKK